ncbi:N-acetylmuramoyl-L-alanine amidase family protein [Deinococcus maricopensis]|uniref:Cell wall hydrolase/autolysin n=1 Tax=Deinococcus maricopensis (strain DSM 21211 / LMG 22137 / NRRL B-23946 / LB-34) TaxID=709986 RepID=E8U8U6_DEIML|nr:N-acetylmuramoyl-L-alanine amidase [Deinococcus maricopensis]ADV67485.1 cell wall hydrolase/autolysin [Deinococcus maricopensis DSM 21211]
MTPRPRLRWLAAATLLAAGLASAQIAFTRLNLFGRATPSVTLYGAEYARDDALASVLRVSRDGSVIRAEGLGHVLLLPLDEDQQRATTDFNTVQLDTQRVNARTATIINGSLYLPLDTLARGLGAQYTPGTFALPAPTVAGVSSRAGQRVDRLVFDVNRDVPLTEELVNGELRLTLGGARGKAGTYTTRGAYLPRVTVASGDAGLVVTAPLTAGSGYRAFKVVRPGSVRVVLDVGPGLPLTVPAITANVARPLVVLDPDSDADAALEVARATGELLTKAGWQVKLTREAGTTPAQRAELARRSDVFVSLTVGRFPGAKRSGLTVVESSGAADSEILSAFRQWKTFPLARYVVGDVGETRRLSDMLRGELKNDGLDARRVVDTRRLMLREAPHAALELELGWPQDTEDRTRLASAEARANLAQAVARSIATYLAARVTKGGA